MFTFKTNYASGENKQHSRNQNTIQQPECESLHIVTSINNMWHIIVLVELKIYVNNNVLR